MKLDRKTEIPNILVYCVLYALVFGISIWLLAFGKESPTNWIPYAGMAYALFAGAVKYLLHLRKTRQPSS